MDYTYTELLAYFLIYSFLGWLAEVCAIALKGQKFCNRGFLNLPFSLSYGVTMTVLILILPTLRSNYVLLFVAALVVSSVVDAVSGLIARRLSKSRLWDYEEHNLFTGGKLRVLYSAALALCYLLAAMLIQPLLFILINSLPELPVKIFCLAVCVLLVLDLIFTLIALHKNTGGVKKSKNPGFSEKVYGFILRRLRKAYPNMGEISASEKGGSFAEGICFDKIFWLFVICSLIGDIIETLYCWALDGVLMSRSSLIYGPFSVVWGIGAVLLTIVLRRLIGKEDRYIFLAGCLIGGVYEYACSVFTEVFFGTTFWDYSDMPFNIGGRTNLLFCIFWGLLSVVWIKILYPKISRAIEKIPLVAGKFITWLLVLFMACNSSLTIAILIRYNARRSDSEAHNAVERFLDENFPDSLVEKRWQNIIIEE